MTLSSTLNMASPERQELIRNAITFLNDPKACLFLSPGPSVMLNDVMVQAQSSPLAQRVQFLEAKGLTAPEIEEAMRQAAATQSGPGPLRTSQQYSAPYQPMYGPVPYAAQPPQQAWDWRDYFVRKLQTSC